MDTLVPMARPQPNRPWLATEMPGGAVAVRAAPRVRAVLSPSTTTVLGSVYDDCTLYRLTGAAAVAGTTVAATITATVTNAAAAAGPMALTDRQNVP